MPLASSLDYIDASVLLGELDRGRYSGLPPEHRHRAADLQVRAAEVVHVDQLLGLDEVGYVAFNSDAARVVTCSALFP